MTKRSIEPFHFEWHRDRRGYELVKVPKNIAPPTPESPNAGFDWGLRALGGPLDLYRPLEDHRGLFRRFAALEGPTDILSFAKEFGELVNHPRKVEPRSFANQTPEWRGAIAVHGIRRIDPDWTDPIRCVAKVIDVLDREGSLAAAHELDRLYLTLDPSATVRIAISERPRRPYVSLVPKSLLGAIHLQLVMAITEATHFKKCEQCPNWFPQGRGTGNRSTRRFCSDRCRVAWNRAKNRQVPGED